MLLRLASALQWTVIALVATAFALALIGAELDQPALRQSLLQWHQWFGLLALATLAASTVTNRLLHLPRPGAPKWHDVLDRWVIVALATLLLLQPLAGWLLASAEGRLAALFGWQLPVLLAPNPIAAKCLLLWHGLQSAVILLLAGLHLRLRVLASIVPHPPHHTPSDRHGRDAPSSYQRFSMRLSRVLI